MRCRQSPHAQWLNFARGCVRIHEVNVVATLSDQQIIQYIQQGRREALAQLFDRYSADLYDFLARLVGDRDQAARLLEEVFMRVPGAVAGLPARESVRGWLYSLAREAGLTWLRQRGWLDGLPPLEEPGPAGLASDIWRAARAMPAFYRAVLIVEELHALSPTEKARALGVQRTDLSRLADEARRSFTRIFDAQARAEGRPTSAQIDTERILGLRRRINAPGATLFGFLPVFVLPESLQQTLRQRIIQAMTGQPLRPIETPPPETPPPPPPVPPVEEEAVEPEPEPEPEPELEPETTTAITTTGVAAEPEVEEGGFASVLPAGALAALAGVALAVVVCGLVYFFLIRDTTPPVIQSFQPADGATVTQSAQMTVSVQFQDDHGVDPTRCCKLQIDGTDVTALAQVNPGNPSSLTWIGPLGLGPHTVTATITDRAGNTAPPATWHFTVGSATPVGTPTPIATALIPTATPLPTLTPIPASLTPLPTAGPTDTATPLPLTATPATPSATPTTPAPTATATQCPVAITGYVFRDLNGNGVFDAGESGFSGVTVTLLNSSGGVISTALSDAFGAYQFFGLPFGTYRVQIAPPSGWYATTPTLFTANMFGCGSVRIDFGLNQVTPTPPPTNTPIVITNTPTTIPPPSSTPTNTTVPPTATNTTVPPTPTNTTVPPTATNTLTATPTPAVTQVPSQITIPGGATQSTSANCPSGSIITGGGFQYIQTGGLEIEASNIVLLGNGWTVTARNTTGGSLTLNAFAICVSNLPGAIGAFQQPMPIPIPPGGSGQWYANCPAGQPLTSGGYAVQPDVQVYVNSPQGLTSWVVGAQNNSALPQTLSVSAICYNHPANTYIVPSGTDPIPGGGNDTVHMACPAGTLITGGGYTAQYGLQVFNSQQSSNGWQISALNTTGGTLTLTGYAVCTGF
jgi:DNA-directed RNA polymerase specialized sigma24 family protein